MAGKMFLPPLTENWEATRATLHNYALAMGIVPAVHALPHPQWWHISLKVHPDGFITENMALPDAGIFNLRIDLRQHTVMLATNAGIFRQFDMTAGLTGTQFGSQILAAVADLGLSGDYARQKFESDETRPYDPAAAERHFDILVNVEQTFAEHRLSLGDSVGLLQIWPHGFDLAFEWFGTRIESAVENGKEKLTPAQLNLGFYPGSDEPYFYSNPLPFEADQLLSHKLPAGAIWHTEGWQGTMLPYSKLAGAGNARERLLDFAKTVYKIASPTLTE